MKRPDFTKPVVLQGPRRALRYPNLGGAGGGKGGSGGAQRAPREDPDSVHSKAFARIKDVVSEGPIAGPIDADGNVLASDQIGRAILFDETQLQNDDGDFNFKNVTVNYVAGTANQSYIPGFDSEEAVIAVGVRAKEAGDTVVRSISNTNVNAVRVTVQIPALVKQNTTTGDVTGYVVQFAIDVNNNGGGWVEKVNRTVRDKISSSYLLDFRIDLDAPGPWAIRLRRISAKENTSSIQNETWLYSYTEIIDGKFRHPFTAMFGIEIDAEQFSSVPNIAYRLAGRIIQVPTNYDPITRAYTGVWDGTFKQAWTDNPAWVYYDVLTSKRYGLGKWVDEGIVDKWALYSIAKECDVLVPDGKGGMEPYMTCNLCIEQEVDAYRLLYDLASCFHGLAVWAGGQFTAVQDVERDAIALFTNANVEGGRFEYTGTSRDARHSVANVFWNNPENLYKREPVYVPNEAQLLKGYNPTDLTAFGATRESQAVRRGRHLLFSEELAKEAVTFVVGLDGAHVRPNKVFKTLDRYRAGRPFGGRVKTPGTASVQLDRPVVLEAGKTYILNCVAPDGTLMQGAVLNTQSTTDTLTITGTPFPFTPLAQSVWLLQSTSLVPAEWECVGIKEEAPGKFRLAGVEYNQSKFGAIINGWALEENPTSELRKLRLVMPPGAISITEEKVSTPITFRVFLNLSWETSLDQYLRGYRVYWRYQNGNWNLMPETVAPNARIETIGEGTYEFRITAINNLGYESGPSSDSYVVGNGSPIANAAITGLEVFGKGNDPTFEGNDCKVVWRMNSAFWHELGEEPNGGDSGYPHPLFRDYVVTIRDGSTFALLRTESVLDTFYVYTHEKNAEDARRVPQTGGSTAARRTFRIAVQVRDRYNNLSKETALIVANPAPQVPGLTIQADLAALVFQFTPVTDLDFVGFVIHASQTNGFTPSDANKVYDGPDTLTRIKLTAGVAWYVKVAAYDAFGKEGLNYSAQFSGTPAITLDTIAPAVPTGAALTSELVQNLDGSQTVKLTATWNPNSEEDFDKYTWRVKEVAGSPFSWVYGTAAGRNSTRVEFTAKANVAYEFQVAASDRDANVSAFCLSATTTTVKDTSPPAPPTWVDSGASYRNIFLAWANPADLDFDSDELYEAPGAVTDPTLATRIFPSADDRPGLRGTSTVISKPATGDFTGQSFNYWLKSRDTSGNRSDFSAMRTVTMAGVPVPTGLSLSTSVETDADGGQRSYITASWDVSAFAEFGGFTIEFSKVSTAGDFYKNSVKANSVKVQVPGNVLFYVRVRQDDLSNGRSAYSAEQSIVSAKDGQAPAAPTSITADAAIRAVVFNWTSPGDLDLAGFQVWRVNGTAGFPGGTPNYVLGRQNSWVNDNLTQGQQYTWYFKSYDTSGNATTTPVSITATPGKIETADISNFAVDLTKRYNSTVALQNDGWTDNSPTSGKIAWNSHTLYFQGAAYTIAAGNTNAVSGDAWVYWDSASPTVYQVSATNPSLTDSQFLIATNVSGVHDLAWNAMANAMIGTAFIQNLGVTNAKILSIVIDKLTAGTVTGQEFIIAGGTAGIIRSSGYVAGSAGWKIDGSGAAEFNNVTVRGAITGSTISIGSGANDVFKVDLSGNIWCGNASFSSAPFRVSNSGVLTASGATITGNVQARSLEVGQTIILGDSVNQTTSIIQSFGFSSGSAGWRVRGNGDAEFNNVTIRGAAILTGSIGSSGGGTTVANVQQGADRANSAINSSLNLVTAFAPGAAAPATGSGLFMGNDKFGFFSGGTWKTFMDNSGNFYLGGTGGKLQWTSGTNSLVIEGSITVNSTINGENAGTVATGGVRANSALNGSNELTTNVVGNVDGTAASTVAQGANRANAGLDNAGKLLTAVLPSATVGANPGSNGLFLGSDYMGYYNSGWKTYMDSNGNFYLGGTSGSLVWDASSAKLTITGSLQASLIATDSSFYNSAYPTSTFPAVGLENGQDGTVQNINGAHQFSLFTVYGWETSTGFASNKFGKSTIVFMVTAFAHVSVTNNGPGLSHADHKGIYRVNGGSWQDATLGVRMLAGASGNSVTGSVSISGLASTDTIEFGVEVTTPTTMQYNQCACSAQWGNL